MAIRDVSDTALAFVQRCQAAAGLTWGQEDYAIQVGALWSCLETFPRREATETGLITIAVAVWRLSIGFDHLIPSFTPIPYRRRLGRPHVYGILIALRDEYANPNLTFASIAQQRGMSRSYLSKELRRDTEHRFPTHLNGVRVLAAIRALKRRGQPIKNLAPSVGYISSGELDRQFQRWFGLSPTVFEGLMAAAPPSAFRSARALTVGGVRDERTLLALR
jgi:AraC-like DNA-binding protein